MRDLFAELKRRNVFKVAVAYVVTAWVVLQAADIVLSAFDAPPVVMRVFIGLLVLCFPVALVLAWAFELTPDGVRREESDAPAKRGGGPGAEADAGAARIGGRAAWLSGRGFNVGIAVLLVAAVSLLGWRHFGAGAGARRTSAAGDTGDLSASSRGTMSALRETTDGIPDKSVAVLPFVNMSGDSAEEYFSEGITDEILSALAQVPGLQVPGRTSSFAFKGKNEDLTTIGAALHVANVLEGSVQRAGDQLRIIVQLINARTGYHRWSHTYNRGVKNAFAVEDEISAAIADALQLKLVGGSAASQSARGTSDVHAHDLYLRGLQYWNRRNPTDLGKAIDDFRQAIAEDSTYADGWAGLAIVLAMPASPLPASKSLPQAERAARRALALDSLLPQAHTALAYALMAYDHDWQGSRAEFDRALAIDPGYPTGQEWLAEWYASQGRTAEAVEVARKAEHLDPLSWIIGWNLGRDLIFDRRYAEAREQFAKLLKLYPKNGQVMASLRDAALLQGDSTLADVPKIREDTLTLRNRLEQLVNNPRAPAKLRARVRDSLQSAGAAATMSFLRRRNPRPDALFQSWDSLLDHRDLGQRIVDVVCGPQFDSLRADPRYKAILRRVGLEDAGRRIDSLRNSPRVAGRR